MPTRPARFQAPRGCYEADTCEPVKQAVNSGQLELHGLARGSYPGDPLPKDRLKEVLAVGYWNTLGEQKWGLPWHRNEGIELTYVARGRLYFGVGNAKYRLSRGSLTITRPWQRHRVGNPHIGSNRYCWLLLDVGVRRPDQPWKWPSWMVLDSADLERLTNLLRHCEQPVWRSDPEIGQCFVRMCEAAEAGRKASSFSRLKLHINELFVGLREMLERREPQLDAGLSSSLHTVQMFLDRMAEEAADEWTLDRMAKQCGLGRSRFTHYCRQVTNLTPLEYLTLSRLQIAQQLLKDEPKLDIVDVAVRSGFQSGQYFSTVFRRQYGCTPGEYRKNKKPSKSSP